MHPVQHNLVAVQVEQFGGIADFIPRFSQVGDAIGVQRFIQSFVEEALFHGHGAAEAPVTGGHVFDHAEFDVVARGELFLMLAQQEQKLLLGFAFQDDAFGEETVTHGVDGGAAFTGRRFRAPGAGAVAFGCIDSSLRAHESMGLPFSWGSHDWVTRRVWMARGGHPIDADRRVSIIARVKKRNGYKYLVIRRINR
jgi:hypothetical protein